MANKNQLEILKQGAVVWNKWRKKNPKVEVDLSGSDLTKLKDLEHVYLNDANLSRAVLQELNLSGAYLVRCVLKNADLQKALLSGTRMNHADLQKANLSGAYLWGTHLRYADLRGAKLKGADLGGASLPMANLRRANLRGAKLETVDFSGADLCGADFSHSLMSLATLANVDLSTVKGLNSVAHQLPSSVGIDTIYLSKGEIPQIFLRGAGIPENFIDYMNSLVGKAYQFYSCFISYSTQDQAFAERLHADLQDNGVRCWFAPKDVRGGLKLQDQIDQAIRLHERLLLVLSHESIKSEWVKTEIAKARKRETEEKRQVLFPIRLVEFDVLRNWEYFDSDIGKDSAREIREYFIPDFSNWKNYSHYQDAFKRLLADLKAK